jgi:uncharacterized tellurite resistance protein B-like protein
VSPDKERFAGWLDPGMAIGRTERFDERKPRVVARFGTDDETLRAVAQLFELMEMAWHDCYGEVSPPEEIVDNVLLCSGGRLLGLIAAARLAVIDRRDLDVWASDLRRQ